jgi:flavin reductase
MTQTGPQVQIGAVPRAAAASVASSEFRAALSKLTTAVSVITTDGPAGSAGVTCSTVCAVSDEPAMVLICVHGKSATNAAIKANGVFCVNCLQAGQQDLSQAFAGVGGIPMAERFALADWETLTTGAPRCRSSLVTLDCQLAELREVGTHTIFIGRVLATAEASQGKPLVYERRAYATTRTL